MPARSQGQRPRPRACPTQLCVSAPDDDFSTAPGPPSAGSIARRLRAAATSAASAPASATSPAATSSMASAAPALAGVRASGLAASSPSTSARRSAGMSGASAGAVPRMRASMASRLISLPNGSCPVSIRYSMTPRLNRSERASTGRPVSCSGLAYATLPRKPPELMISLSSTLARPRSDSLTSPCSDTSTLQGERSRCTTPRAWR